MAAVKMADGAHICEQNGFVSILAQLDIDKNILTKFKKINTVALQDMQ